VAGNRNGLHLSFEEEEIGISNLIIQPDLYEQEGALVSTPEVAAY
jgi:hypothetical protein